MKYLRLLLFIIIPSVFLINCTEKKTTINVPVDKIDGLYYNTPVIVNVQDSYSFSVFANNLTYSTENNLVFTSDSSLVTLTLTNISSANSYMKLLNDKNEEIFVKSLNNNEVLVNSELSGDIPKKIKIELDDFSGVLTITVASYVP